ncbi:hypothetical protein FU659_14895 [Paenibacillus sp. N3.4]|nr:hypothetical protein [Paenibacillus sp. N3.4]TXK82616.1 hypothetical protein FU659_14895 [Paenibacillus sp. N3.4]
MAERFYESLEYVEINGQFVRAHDLKYEVVDEVLHFFLSLDVPLMKERPIGTKMLHIKKE